MRFQDTSQATVSLGSDVRAVYVVVPGGRTATGGMCRMADYFMSEWSSRGRQPPLVLVDSTGPYVKWRVPLYFIRAFLRILADALRGRIGLLHIHVAERGSVVRKGLLIRLASVFGIPVVAHMHGADFIQFYDGLPAVLQNHVARTLQRATRVAVLGESWRRFFVESVGLDPLRVRILHNAGPGPAVLPDRPSAAICRLVFSGVLSERKGLQELLDALGSADLKASDWHLDVVGNGDQAPFQQQAEAFGIAAKVSFHGWVASATMHAILAQSEVLVLPSRNEGLPMVIIEAMAHGLAVVSTPVGSIPDAVKHGVTGILVPPKDVEALTAALDGVVRDPQARRRMGELGRAAFLREFEISHLNDRLQDIFTEAQGGYGATSDGPTQQARPATDDSRLDGQIPGQKGVLTRLALVAVSLLGNGRKNASGVARRPQAVDDRLPYAGLRIAIYMHDFAGGGVERNVISLARLFLNHGARVTLLVNLSQGELLPLLPDGVEVVVFGVRRTVLALLPLARYLSRDKPDILLGSLDHNNILAAIAKAVSLSQAKLVVVQHSALSSEASSEASWKYRLVPLCYWMLSPLTAGFVAVSSGVADDLSATTGIARKRINVIYNPVVGPDFDRLKAGSIDHPWFRESSIPVFVSAGRLVPLKDHETLLRAFAVFHKRSPGRLMILGDGPLRGMLESLVIELGLSAAVEFSGFVENPLPFIREAAALILSSRYEGFGNVLVEALGCGTPVISTNCPFGPTEILADGEFGRLVPVGAVDLLAEALDPMLRTFWPADKLQERAQVFSEAASAIYYLELFSRLCRIPQADRQPS